MKKITLIVLLITPLFFFSCLQNNNNSSDPKEVLAKFFKYLSDKDIKAARKITTQDSQLMLDNFEQEIKLNKDSKAMEKFSKENIEMADAKIDADKASILVTEKSTEKGIYYILRKENNSWKVHLDAAAMLVESFEQLSGQGINAADSISKAMQELRALNMDTVKNKLKNDDKK